MGARGEQTHLWREFRSHFTALKWGDEIYCCARLGIPQQSGMFTYCYLFLIEGLISCRCVQQKRRVKNVNIPSIRGKRDGCEIKCRDLTFKVTVSRLGSS